MQMICTLTTSKLKQGMPASYLSQHQTYGHGGMFGMHPQNMCESPAAPQDSHRRLILDRTNVSRQQTIHDHALLADEVMGLSFSGGCCSQLWEVLLTTCNCTDFGGPGWG